MIKNHVPPLLLLFTLLCFWPGAMAAVSPADVRLVIDVSGSMKSTDPQNLRVPALELVVKLLPDGSRAGIWVFADDIEPLVPLARVDDDWRQRALAQAGQVDSAGQLTDMGEALEEVVLADDNPAQVIFLTDGKVDIGTNARHNSRERTRILETLLPAIEATGSRLHTIALSADADAELMAMLSRATDGLHSVVDAADELMPVFLQILDQSVPAVRLPLEDNRFRVDDSVDEFTALVFHQAGSTPTRLVPPEGEAVTVNSHGEAVKWYAADSYDLVTVTDPATGYWRIDGADSARNRVTVVSDLQLVVEPLPGNLVAGEALILQFYFLADGERLTDTRFLQLLEADILIEQDGSPARWEVSLDAEPMTADGTFTQPLPALRERGQYQLTLRVDGKSFEREYRHWLQVGALLGVQMRKLADPLRYRIQVSADPRSVDVEHTAVVAQIKTSVGRSYLETLSMLEPGLWVLDITPREHARYAVELDASGRDVNGDPVRETLPTQFFTYPAEGEEPPPGDSEAVRDLRRQLERERAELAALRGEPERPPPDNTDTASSAASSSSSPENEPVATEPRQPAAPAPADDSGGINWLWVGLAIVGNLLLLGLIYLGYRKFSTRNVIDELEEIEQQLVQPQEKTPAAAKAPAAGEEEDPMKALDAMSSPGAEDGEALFPLDDKPAGAEPPMDDLDEDETADDGDDERGPPPG